jgi:hypothetical protein
MRFPGSRIFATAHGAGLHCAGLDLKRSRAASERARVSLGEFANVHQRLGPERPNSTRYQLLKPLLERFGDLALSGIRTADIEDYVADLKMPRLVNGRPGRRLAPCALCGTHAPIERKMRQNQSDSSTISRVGGNQYRWIKFEIIPIGMKPRIVKMMRYQPLAPARNDKPAETTIVSTPPFRLEEYGIRICAPHSSQLKLELRIRPNACLSPQAGHFRAVFRSSGFDRTRTQPSSAQNTG